MIEISNSYGGDKKLISVANIKSVQESASNRYHALIQLFDGGYIECCESYEDVARKIREDLK